MDQAFTRLEIQTSDAEVRIIGRRGGKGPPLLLLHGNPLTHLSWQRIAPRLAQERTMATTRSGAWRRTRSR